MIKPICVSELQNSKTDQRLCDTSNKPIGLVLLRDECNSHGIRGNPHCAALRRSPPSADALWRCPWSTWRLVACEGVNPFVQLFGFAFLGRSWQRTPKGQDIMPKGFLGPKQGVSKTGTWCLLAQAYVNVPKNLMFWSPSL